MSVEYIVNNIKFSHESEENVGQFSIGLLSSIPSFHDKTILDIGAGNGVLSIAAVKLGAKHVIINDIEKKFIQESKRNCFINDVLEHCSFVHSCCSKIPSKMFSDVDLILVNPPQLPSIGIPSYYNNNGLALTFKSGGDDGYDVIRIILSRLSISIHKNVPIYITISPLLDEDILFDICDKNNFKAELFNSHCLDIPISTIDRMTYEPFRRKIDPSVKPKVRIYRIIGF